MGGRRDQGKSVMKVRNVRTMSVNHRLYSAVRSLAPDRIDRRQSDVPRLDSRVVFLVPNYPVTFPLEQFSFGCEDAIFTASLAIKIVNAKNRARRIGHLPRASERRACSFLSVCQAAIYQYSEP